MYRLILAMGMAAATCFALGCGSSGSEATSAPLSKAQFIKQADGICAKAVKEREAAADSWRKELPGGAAEAEAKLEEGFKEVIAPALQQEAEELEALAAPEKDQNEVAKMLTTLSHAGQVIAQEGPRKALGS